VVGGGGQVGWFSADLLGTILMRGVTGALVARLRDEVSVQRLVEGAGIALVERRGKLTGGCPWCGTVKALRVDRAANTWACAACDERGGPIEWVMRAEGVSERHAVELLREGLPVSTTPAGSGPKRSTVPKLQAPFDAGMSDAVLLDAVVAFYHRALLEESEALAWLARRRINEEATRAFRLGLSNRTLCFRLPHANRVEGRELRERLQDLGVYRKSSGHEAFRGSVTFPIVDPDGQVVQLYGRKIGGALRKGTPLHTWLASIERPLFNVAALESFDEVIVCASIIDALSFWSAGLRHVVAVAGPEGVDASHLALFAEHELRRVLIAFRRDTAGDREARRLADRLAPGGVECLRVELPQGADVNDYACSLDRPADGLVRVVRAATWMAGKTTTTKVKSAVKASTAVKPLAEPGVGTDEPVSREPVSDAPEPSADESDTDDQVADDDVDDGEGDGWLVSPVPFSPPPGAEPTFDEQGSLWLRFADRRWRVRGLERNTSFDVLRVQVMVTRQVSGPGAGFHMDTFDLCAARARAGFCKEAAGEVAVDETVLRKDLGQVLGAAEGFVEEAIRRAQEPVDTRVVLDADERATALELLQDRRLVDRIVADFARAGMVGEATNCLVGYLAAVSRKLAKPLAVVVQSTSAAGKSALMEAVLEFVPPEERVSYSAMTGQSLYYMGEGDLAHKVLAVAEEEGAERAAYALKLLQSEGSLSIASTGKDNSTGRLVTHDYTVKGPAAIFLTTTAIDIDEELLNRCVVLTVDEDRAQTRAIHDRQRRSHTLAGLLAGNERDGIIKQHRDAQRLLEPVAVVNPFADRLGFADTATRTRRDHVKYLTLISAVALLHQHQRQRHTAHTADGTDITYIEATLDDIAVANRLAHEVLGRSLDELPPQTRRLLGIIDTLVAQRAEADGLTRDRVRFTRRDVRGACGLSDVQCRKHLDRLVELEYLLVHKGSRGSSFVYELVFGGDIDDPTPRLAGLVDVDVLTGGAASTTPTSPPDGAKFAPLDGEFAPPTPPQRPPVDPTSPPATSGANGQVNGTKRADSPGNGSQNTSRGPVGQAVSHAQPAIAAPAANGSRRSSNGSAA
jgi:hypothetical protein